ncbi:hypothetical protein THASP1DRAFT_32033 [Thamnocephalis sphaerospora]|uniref:Uncharacterized protein n=1 Tax=Thamnocephalis sphaerospora TaxID=78915 RepID=A0A4P9XK29_9FUNG|nr:hypothetical protein THASP1DRAFT_32033 [Thamnocephalis sphaerospora]|eukprot:RKP06147.1 hypothetical protein THASP1DRAFT_32033 [Thamnocephalis sphaerospora]
MGKKIKEQGSSDPDYHESLNVYRIIAEDCSNTLCKSPLDIDSFCSQTNMLSEGQCILIDEQIVRTAIKDMKNYYEYLLSQIAQSAQGNAEDVQSEQGGTDDVQPEQGDIDGVQPEQGDAEDVRSDQDDAGNVRSAPSVSLMQEERQVPVLQGNVRSCKGFKKLLKELRDFFAKMCAK